MVLAQEKIEWQQPTETILSRKRTPVKRVNRQDRWKSFIMLGLTVAVAGSIGVETLNLTVVKGAEVRDLEKKIAVIKANNDLLQFKVDQLRSVGRIESSALAMGMEKPTGTVYVSGNLTATNQQMGVPASTQVATPAAANKNSVVKQFSQLITSFFASTQR
ncbi:MAG: septum formation initiator [Desulfitobacteriaceae bacterium]